MWFIPFGKDIYVPTKATAISCCITDSCKIVSTSCTFATQTGFEPPYVSKTGSLRVKWCFVWLNDTKYSKVLQCIIRCCNVLSCKIVSTYRRLHTHLKRYKKLYKKHGVLWVKMTFCIIERYKLQKVLHCIKLLRNCILTNCINMM